MKNLNLEVVLVVWILVFILAKDDKTQMDQFISDIALIAKKLDVSEKVDAIEADNVEDYLNKLMPIIRGKFATWIAEEYVYVKDGADKIGYSLGKRSLWIYRF